MNAPDSTIQRFNDSTPLEVLPPADHTAFLAAREANITYYAAQIENGEKLNDGWRFLVGLEIHVAKRRLPHGDFLPWLENVYQKVEQRTARRYVAFAELAMPLLETVSKSDSLSDLPRLIENGDLSEQQRVDTLAAVGKLVAGRGYAAWTKAHTEKPARKITFHCEHCGCENTGFIGREITCVNKECAEKITVKETTTPEEQIKAAIKDAEDLFTAAVNAVRVAREHKHRIDVSTDLWNALANECIELGREKKAVLKKRKAAKGRKGAGAKGSRGAPASTKSTQST